MKWQYGVTTVPDRLDNLLPQTLASLSKAGFDKPRLFVDGTRCLEEYAFLDLEVTIRYPKVRTYGNWVLSAWELLIRDPNADRYAIFQDDLVTYHNLREYLERCEYPAEGYWNLYTFPQNEKLNSSKSIGWFRSNQMGRGAVGLVFNREALLKLLATDHMVRRPLDERRGWRSVDGGIVTALKKQGYAEYVHHPSLVQHTGKISSMKNRPHPQAESFRGEDFNALDLL